MSQSTSFVISAESRPLEDSIDQLLKNGFQSIEISMLLLILNVHCEDTHWVRQVSAILAQTSPGGIL